MIRPILYLQRFGESATAILVHLRSGFAYLLLTTSISNSIVEDTRESIFSRSIRRNLSRFEGFYQVMFVFTGWPEWSTCFALLARKDLAWVLSSLQSRHLLLLGVLSWEFAIHDALWCWVPRRWGFGCPGFQPWLSCKFEVVSSRFYCSKFRTPGGFNLRTIFLWAKSI